MAEGQGGSAGTDVPPLELTSWSMEIRHDLPPLPDPDALTPFPLGADLSLCTTLTIDAEAYAQLLDQVWPAPRFTVTQSFDLNPWHRQTRSTRARARKLWAIAGWEFRRRILRRAMLESVEITIPDCRVLSQ